MTTSPVSPPPGWFSAVPFDEAPRHEIAVQGAQIHFRSVQNGVGPTVLFVHGGLAHSAWWSPIICLLGDSLANWATMDLSGHGDSEWRERYDQQVWREEVLAVARQVSGTRGCILVGHSLGGMVSLRAASADSEAASPLLRGVISIDGVPRDSSRGGITMSPSTSAGFYTDRADGAREFADRPARRNWPRWLATFAGERGLRDNGHGWVWKHDGSARSASSPPIPRLDAAILAPLTLITGSDSAFAAEMKASDFVTQAGSALRQIEIARAGHDVMMEQPEIFAGILRSILEAEEN